MRQAAPTLKTLLCASAILGGVLAGGRAASAADHPNVQPGNWEITISMEMPGMPARPAMTNTHCIKPDQVKDSQSFADSMQERTRDRKCKFSDFKLESDKLSYSFTCESGATGTSELVFGGTTYEGTTKITVPGRGNGPMTMTQHFKAKRVGDC
jgi:Protein of unknown function (DUF3617)